MEVEKLGEGNELDTMIEEFEEVCKVIRDKKIKGFSVKSEVWDTCGHDIIKFGKVKIIYDRPSTDYDIQKSIKRKTNFKYNKKFTITKDGRETSNQEECLQILQKIMPVIKKKCGIESVEDVADGILSQLRFLGNDN